MIMNDFLQKCVKCYGWERFVDNGVHDKHLRCVAERLLYRMFILF